MQTDALPRVKDPMLQKEQLLAAGAEYVFDGQPSHTIPVDPDAVPALQGTHSPRPGRGLAKPAGHGVHMMPLKPGAQVLHFVRFMSGMKPMPHLMQCVIPASGATEYTSQGVQN